MKLTLGEYYKIINHEIKVEKKEVFKYLDTPLELACKEIYRGYGKIQDKNNGIKNAISYFYISTDISANAMAGITNGNGVIKIHIGLVKFWEEIFFDNIHLNQHLNDPALINLNQSIRGIRQLMFKVSSIFTYYHEFAHIIQLKFSGRNNNFQEMYQNTKRSDHNQQLREFDADFYSTIQITNHLRANILEPLLESDGPKEDVKSIIEYILCFSIMSIQETIYNFQTIHSPIVINGSNTHPHPILRLILISSTLIDELVTYLRCSRVEMNLTEEKLVEIVEKTAKSVFPKENILKKIRLNAKEVNFDPEYYLSDVLRLIKSDPKFASYNILNYKPPRQNN